MAKAKTVFFCSECGGESVRWMGKCPHCGAWNTLVEEKVEPAAAAPASAGRATVPATTALPLPQVSGEAARRWLLGLNELDAVLGGGLVPGSSVLLGGEPGIGKSTLLLQAARCMAVHGRTLYVSGEESAAQIRNRAERLAAVDDQVWLLAQTEIHAALSQAEQVRPSLLIIDSVQAMFSSDLTAAPGSISQVRAVSAAALAYAHTSGAAVILVGHVTKEGMLAGPRVLEHMVDTVLYFEGERYNAFRLLRAVKNRFGSTNEVGVFEMTAQGLTPLLSPSAYFLSGRRAEQSGSTVCCVLQGTRPLLVEIQALTVKSGFANPRRQAIGYDFNRLVLLIAVLERKLGLNLGDQDVYLNVAGGMRVDDPAADLAAAAAVASAFLDKPVEQTALLLGEVGLLGEVRPVSQEERRLKEAAAFGFAASLTPTTSASTPAPPPTLRRLPVPDLAQALRLLGLR